MVYLGIFVLELFLLFIFSRSLTNSLARLLYKISHNRTFAFNSLAVIYLPGTIIHEIAHMLIAGLMLVPSGEIDIFPQIEENGVRFGSVKIAECDPIRRFIIGVAPVIVGLSLMLVLMIIGMQLYNPQTPWWQIAIVVFLVFEIANTMFASKKDMEGALVLLLVIMVILTAITGILYFTQTLPTVLGWISHLDLPNTSGYIQKAASLLLIPLGIDLGLIIIGKTLRA